MTKREISPKRIHAIEGSPDVLKTVKTYFSEINANYSVFRTLEESLGAPRPDLIVMHISQFHETLEEAFRWFNCHERYCKIPLILISSRGASKGFLPPKESHHSFFREPVEKLAFLNCVARFLGIPPRRLFRIVMSVRKPDDSLRFTGISVDFSDTGMSFECNSSFPVGMNVDIAFVNPKSRRRFLLSSVIARRSELPDDKGFFYGVRFTSLKPDDAAALGEFIAGRG